MAGRGTTSVARGAARVGPARQGKQQTARVVLYITGTVVSFWLAVRRLPDLVKDFVPQFGPEWVRDWVSVGVGLAFPAAIILTCEVLPAWWQRRRDRRLIDWGTGGLLSPVTSGPRPIPAITRISARYQRLTCACRGPRLDSRGTGELLYLIGKSGTGKSSLLGAYVLPELRAGTPRFVTLSMRSFGEPLRELDEALRQPGAIYKQPPKDLPRDLPAGCAGSTRSSRPTTCDCWWWSINSTSSSSSTAATRTGRRRCSGCSRTCRIRRSTGSGSFSLCAPTTSTTCPV